MTKPLRNLKVRLADGLAAWLSYEFACERGYLFSEYYLASPLGQLLRAGGRHVRAEEPHPTLSVIGRSGRPPSIDFVVYDEDKTTPMVAVETKWAGYSDVTAGALAWDAFRLEAFHRKTGAPGLLILGGTAAKLHALFESTAFRRLNQKDKTTSKPTLLFPLPDRPHRFVLKQQDLSKSAAAYVDEKIQKSPAGSIATDIHVELPQISEPDGPKAISFSIYVWEVRSITTE